MLLCCKVCRDLGDEDQMLRFKIEVSGSPPLDVCSDADLILLIGY